MLWRGWKEKGEKKSLHMLLNPDEFRKSFPALEKHSFRWCSVNTYWWDDIISSDRKQLLKVLDLVLPKIRGLMWSDKNKQEWQNTKSSNGFHNEGRFHSPLLEIRIPLLWGLAPFTSKTVSCGSNLIVVFYTIYILTQIFSLLICYYLF